MNASAATLALFVLLLMALAVDACAHRPDLTASVQLDAGVQAGGAAQAGAAAQSTTAADSKSRVAVHGGGFHFRASIVPPADGGCPAVAVGLDDDGDDVEAEATGAADAGAQGAADAGAAFDGGAHLSGAADAGASSTPAGFPWRACLLAFACGAAAGFFLKYLPAAIGRLAKGVV